MVLLYTCGFYYYSFESSSFRLFCVVLMYLADVYLLLYNKSTLAPSSNY